MITSSNNIHSLRSGVKGRGEGEGSEAKKKKRRGTGERERKETPAARTPHSAFCPHIKEACYQWIIMGIYVHQMNANYNLQAECGVLAAGVSFPSLSPVPPPLFSPPRSLAGYNIHEKITRF